MSKVLSHLRCFSKTREYFTFGWVCLDICDVTSTFWCEVKQLSWDNPEEVLLVFNADEAFHLPAAPSQPLTHFVAVVVLKLSHNAKCNWHAWGSDVRAQGKSSEDVCFGPLRNKTEWTQNDPRGIRKLNWNKSFVSEQSETVQVWKHPEPVALFDDHITWSNNTFIMECSWMPDYPESAYHMVYEADKITT